MGGDEALALLGLGIIELRRKALILDIGFPAAKALRNTGNTLFDDHVRVFKARDGLLDAFCSQSQSAIWKPGAS